jgi:hypothetical protein
LGNATNQPLWFAGVCDSVLAKVSWWLSKYECGEVSRTRKFLDPVRGPVDIPTQYMHILAFSQREFDCLSAIVSAMRPDSSLAEDVERVRQNVAKTRKLPRNQYAVPLWFWRDDVAEIQKALLEARDGGKKTGIEGYVGEKLEEAKPLWEV